MVEQTEQTQQAPQESTPKTIVDKAEEVVKKLEEANKRSEEILLRHEQLVAKQLLSGRSVGAPTPQADPEEERLAFLRKTFAGTGIRL